MDINKVRELRLRLARSEELRRDDKDALKAILSEVASSKAETGAPTYAPSDPVVGLADVLSRLVTDGLIETDLPPSVGVEALLLVTALCADAIQLKKTAMELRGMAGAIDALRNPTQSLCR